MQVALSPDKIVLRGVRQWYFVSTALAGCSMRYFLEAVDEGKGACEQADQTQLEGETQSPRSGKLAEWDETRRTGTRLANRWNHVNESAAPPERSCAYPSTSALVALLQKIRDK